MELKGFYNIDCMEGMREIPDKFFDWAITDPPYGIGIGSMNYTNSGAVMAGRNSLTRRRDYRKKGDWDAKRPNKEYFDELFRVSKNQIIWGGNYFADLLPPSKSFIVWDKRVDEKYNNDFSDCEMAWCSYGVARVYRYLWNGMLQGNMQNKEERFHPTQKPVCLYEWLLRHYAKPGDKILDTHVGSGSSLIACYNMGFEYLGFELDKEYFMKATERIENIKAQCRLW